MVVSTFSILDKDGKKRFFEVNFLLADVKRDIVLEMFFLIMSHPDINFQARNLQKRSQTTKNVFPTTRKVKLIGKKEFATIAHDLEHKIIVIHVAALSFDSDDKMHFSRKAQIAYLKVGKASIEVSNKYANFISIFLLKLIVKLSKYMDINNHTIKLVDN